MDVQSISDTQQPAQSGVGGARLDALDREPLDAGQVAESLLR